MACTSSGSFKKNCAADGFWPTTAVNTAGQLGRGCVVEVPKRLWRAENIVSSAASSPVYMGRGRGRMGHGSEVGFREGKKHTACRVHRAVCCAPLVVCFVACLSCRVFRAMCFVVCAYAHTTPSHTQEAHGPHAVPRHMMNPPTPGNILLTSASLFAATTHLPLLLTTTHCYSRLLTTTHYYSLPITHYYSRLLMTTHYLLLTTTHYYILTTTHYLLLTPTHCCLLLLTTPYYYALLLTTIHYCLLLLATAYYY